MRKRMGREQPSKARKFSCFIGCLVGSGGGRNTFEGGGGGREKVGGGEREGNGPCPLMTRLSIWSLIVNLRFCSSLKDYGEETGLKGS